MVRVCVTDQLVPSHNKRQSNNTVMVAHIGLRFSYIVRQTLSIYLLIHPIHGFHGIHRQSSSYMTATIVSALTERQMQFWEDVEEGLKDMEAYYLSTKGLNMDRIHQFSKRYVLRL
jgi:hypothetical protein